MPNVCPVSGSTRPSAFAAAAGVQMLRGDVNSPTSWADYDDYFPQYLPCCTTWQHGEKGWVVWTCGELLRRRKAEVTSSHVDVRPVKMPACTLIVIPTHLGRRSDADALPPSSGRWEAPMSSSAGCAPYPKEAQKKADGASWQSSREPLAFGPSFNRALRSRYA